MDIPKCRQTWEGEDTITFELQPSRRPDSFHYRGTVCRQGDLYTTEIACTIDRTDENDRPPSFVARGGDREYQTIQDALDAVSKDAISDLRAASGQSRANFG